MRGMSTISKKVLLIASGIFAISIILLIAIASEPIVTETREVIDLDALAAARNSREVITLDIPNAVTRPEYPREHYMMIPITTWPDMAYCSNDIKLLANIMYIEEEEYQDDLDAELVFKMAGSVVLNRMLSDLFPNTIEGVIYQEGQYAQETLDKIGNVYIPEKVYMWAEDLLRDGPIGPENLVFQSQFEQGDQVYWTYGNQIFCLSYKIETADR